MGCNIRSRYQKEYLNLQKFAIMVVDSDRTVGHNKSIKRLGARRLLAYEEKQVGYWFCSTNDDIVQY